MRLWNIISVSYSTLFHYNGGSTHKKNLPTFSVAARRLGGTQSSENCTSFLAVYGVSIRNIVFVLMDFSRLCCMGTYTHTQNINLHSLVENRQTVVICSKKINVIFFIIYHQKVIRKQWKICYWVKVLNEIKILDINSYIVLRIWYF